MVTIEKLPKIEIDPETFLRQHCTLPSLPQMLSHLQKLIKEENVDLDEVVKHINSEPSLVAQIFKVVNSSYFGLPRQISDLRYAISFLGLDEIYHLVLSLSVINTVSIKDRSELNKFWFHSFLTAITTKQLTKKYAPFLPFDDLWIGAILHDIGKLVYLKFFPDHFKALQAYREEVECLLSEAERHFSLPASSYLGSLLCGHWRLPVTVQYACNFHSLVDLQDIKDDSSLDSFNKMICLGNLMAVLVTDQLKEEKKKEIYHAIQGAVDCSEDDLMVMSSEVKELKAEAERFLTQFQ